jgi:hypothetical protein
MSLKGRVAVPNFFKETTVAINKTDCVYTGICACFLPVFAELYYRQTILYGGAYVSDTPAYVEFATNPDVPSIRAIPWVFRKLYAINEATWEIAIFLALLTVGIMMAIYCLLRLLLSRDQSQSEVPRKEWMLIPLALSAFFARSIYIPAVFDKLFVGTYKGMHFHSPTQSFMVLFGLVAVYYFIKLFDSRWERVNWKQWIVFSLSLLLSAWGKPNAVMGFLPVAALLLVVTCVRAKDLSLLFKIKRFLLLSSSAAPALIYCGILYAQIYADDKPTKVILDYGSRFFANDRLLLMILCGLAFPITITILNHKKFKADYIISLAWLLFISNTLITILFAESGDRYTHGNFGWGVSFAVLVLFTVSVDILMGNWRNRVGLRSEKVAKLQLFSPSILLVMHVIPGIVYVVLVLRGLPPWSL